GASTAGYSDRYVGRKAELEVGMLIALNARNSLQVALCGCDSARNPQVPKKTDNMGHALLLLDQALSTFSGGTSSDTETFAQGLWGSMKTAAKLLEYTAATTSMNTLRAACAVDYPDDYKSRKGQHPMLFSAATVARDLLRPLVSGCLASA
ncbi:MAG: hypothetical protein AAF219_07775, partial [Myxococcota bacterium]